MREGKGSTFSKMSNVRAPCSFFASGSGFFTSCFPIRNLLLEVAAQYFTMSLTDSCTSLSISHESQLQSRCASVTHSWLFTLCSGGQLLQHILDPDICC